MRLPKLINVGLGFPLFKKMENIMSIELWALLVAGVMTYLTILFQQLNMSKSLGTNVSLSNRDIMPEETPLGGRLRRAAINGVESVAVFAPLVIIGQFTDTSNAWTQYAAIAFLISRILYMPSYALKLVPIRTIVWSLGFFALPFFLYGLIG